jgi:hypothetical protein
MHNAGIKHQHVACAAEGIDTFLKLVFSQVIIRGSYRIVRRRGQNHKNVEPIVSLEPFGPIPHSSKRQVLSLAPRLQDLSLTNPLGLRWA